MPLPRWGVGRTRGLGIRGLRHLTLVGRVNRLDRFDGESTNVEGRGPLPRPFELCDRLDTALQSGTGRAPATLAAAREPDELYADINAILAGSREPNAEEWAIHDYEQFGRWKVGEFDSIEQISRVAKNIAEHGYAYSAWADVFDGEDASFDTDAFHEAYLGHYDSVTDYVEQMADDLGYEQKLDKLPEYLRGYTRIDYAAIGRDMELSGDIATVQDPNGGLWIFRAKQ